MINIAIVRKRVGKNSSDKLKRYSGICSLTKRLKNGYGATFKTNKTINIGNHKYIFNIRIVSCGNPIIKIKKPIDLNMKNVFLIGNGINTAVAIAN